MDSEENKGFLIVFKVSLLESIKIKADIIIFYALKERLKQALKHAY
ncbi:MAG: hypothetical protein ACI910_003134 [Oleispira sp.]